MTGRERRQDPLERGVERLLRGDFDGFGDGCQDGVKAVRGGWSHPCGETEEAASG